MNQPLNKIPPPVSTTECPYCGQPHAGAGSMVQEVGATLLLTFAAVGVFDFLRLIAGALNGGH